MRHLHLKFAIPVSLLVVSALSLPAAAVTRTWPGIAPCNTTLQACIDGAINGDRIEIATETPINESPNFFQRSLELVAANGFRPRLADNHNIFVSSAPISGDQTVLIDGIRVRNGYVTANYLGVGIGNYTIRNMVLEAGATGAGGYIASSVARNTLNLTLYNNDVRCSPNITQNSSVRMDSAAATTLNANVFNNKVTCSTQDGVPRQ
ncbi:MAG: hypothetical protein ABIR16_02650 [Dokdonella sp.]